MSENNSGRILPKLTPKSIKQKSSITDIIQILLIILSVLFLVVTLVFPLIKLFLVALEDRAGNFIGLQNFIDYFTTPSAIQPLYNTLFIAIIVGIVSVTLSFIYAYGITRTNMRWKSFFRYTAFIPLFAPTMMYAIGLINLFGNNGVVTNGMFGLPGIDISLYGSVGIIISLILYTFPQAFLLLIVSLSNTDNRLYEAADSLDAGVIRKFFTVTLPSMKYGLFSAFIIAFILTFTDFGAPIVIGGGFKVIAIDLYQQVVGQFNMSMGATVGVILIIPAFIAFVADRIIQGKSAGISAQAVPYRIKENKLRDNIFFIYSLFITGLITILMLAVILPTFVDFWPYELGFTWDHYTFSNVIGGFQPVYNSLFMAFFTALFGTIIVFAGAYLKEKSKFLPKIRGFGYFLSIVPLAVPGLAIGLAYIFFFNQPEFAIPFTNLTINNPLSELYGTIWILILANMIHFYSVNFLTATTALKQLDSEFESTSESMKVPFYKTFHRITVPMSLPALLEMAVYFFVNSMTTISAVIFLYSPSSRPAAVAIVDRVGAGYMQEAAALAVVIFGINVIVRIGYELVSRTILRKTSVWRG